MVTGLRGAFIYDVPVVYSSSQAAFYGFLDKELDAIRQAGTWKSERVITTPQSSLIGVTTRKDKVLNFCANNYLGLSVISQTF